MGQAFRAGSRHGRAARAQDGTNDLSRLTPGAVPGLSSPHTRGPSLWRLNPRVGYPIGTTADAVYPVLGIRTFVRLPGGPAAVDARLPRQRSAFAPNRRQNTRNPVHQPWRVTPDVRPFAWPRGTIVNNLLMPAPDPADYLSLPAGRGLTQQEPGAAVGVSRQTINAIEAERYTPSLPLAIALARFFQTRVEEMFDDTTQ